MKVKMKGGCRSFTFAGVLTAVLSDATREAVSAWASWRVARVARRGTWKWALAMGRK